MVFSSILSLKNYFIFLQKLQLIPKYSFFLFAFLTIDVKMNIGDIMYINARNEEIIYNSIDKNDFLSISMAGTTVPNPNYHIIHNINKNFFYDYYVFEYVISGKGYIEYGKNQKVEVTAGDFYFLNKLHKHIYYSDKYDPFKKIFIVAKGVFIDSLIRAFDIDKPVIKIKKDVRYIIESIHEKLLKSDIDYNAISHDILSLFHSFDFDLYNESNQSMKLPDMIRKYLDTSITHKITLNKISEELNISKSHIERVFKERFNQTPLNYFMEQKTKYACALLVNTSYSIATIAEQTGFSDPKYMSKCIKKETGMTPLQYRKHKTNN